jgi:hypothetical protein
MRFNLLARKTHHWLAFAVALPVLVIIGTGLLLQVKKQWTWVQPAEQSGTPPGTGRLEIPASARRGKDRPSGWADAHRVDVASDAVSHLEERLRVQVDLGNGSAAERLRSDSSKRSTTARGLGRPDRSGSSCRRRGTAGAVADGPWMVWRCSR